MSRTVVRRTVVSGAGDPGLQPERTALSWRRTVLAQVVVAAGLVHLVPGVPGGAGVLAVAGTAVLAACATALLVRHRQSALGAPRAPGGGGLAEPAGRGGMPALGVAAGTSALGVAALLAVAAGAW